MMRLRFLSITIIALLISMSINAQSISVSGATFPATMKIGDKTVEYNGAGVRTKYFFKLYVAALYIQSKSTNAQSIIDQDIASAIRLKMMSSKVTRERFIETVRDGFSTSSEGKASKQEIDALMRLFKTEFKEGDDIILMYFPQSGIEVYMNGKHLGGVKGLEFKKALWGIWLGKTPADKSVKNSMLGL